MLYVFVCAEMVSVGGRRIVSSQGALVHSTDDTEIAAANDTTSAQLVELCGRLGMFPSAPHSLATQYTRPMVMLVSTLLALLLGQGAFAILYFGGFPWPTWRAIIPEFIFLCNGIFTGVGFYLWGPAFVSHPWMTPVSAAVAPFLAYLTLSPFVGAQEYVPFGNRLSTTVVLTAGAFGIFFVSKACDNSHGSANSAKVGPQVILVQTAMMTLHSVNNLTDFGVIRVIVSEVWHL